MNPDLIATKITWDALQNQSWLVGLPNTRHLNPSEQVYKKG